MIKFFRKIRQRLLSENKFSKYMIYAIGEIILVVIGILIALSINNWNEQNKENEIEHKYMKRLVIDIAADSIHFENKIIVSERAKKNLYQFIHKLYENQKSIEDVKQLFTHFHVQTDHLTIQNSTYKELISSGKINLLKNEAVKNSITEYYRITEDIIAQIKEFNLFATQILIESSGTGKNGTKFFMPDIYDDPSMILDGEWGYFNNPLSDQFVALERAAGIYHERNKEDLAHYNRLKMLSSNLKTKLENELESKNTE